MYKATARFHANWPTGRRKPIHEALKQKSGRTALHKRLDKEVAAAAAADKCWYRENSPSPRLVKRRQPSPEHGDPPGAR